MFVSFPKLVADSFLNVMQVTSFSYVKHLHLLFPWGESEMCDLRCCILFEIGKIKKLRS